MSKILSKEEAYRAYVATGRMTKLYSSHEALRADIDEAKALLCDVQSSAVQAGHERWKRIDAFLARTTEVK